MPAIPTNGASNTYTITTYDSETLLLGSTHLDCGTPVAGCTLSITGSSHTDVTIRGDSDGTITVGTTGATGATAWYLSGAYVTSGASASHVFSGLTAGTYDVSAIDENDCVAGVEDIIVLDGEFRTDDFSVSSPTGLTAVESPIIIGVSTAVNNPNPLSGLVDFDIDGTIDDGDSITFTLTSPFAYTQTFWAKSYPSKPNYFLASVLNNASGIPTGTNTATEIATSLAEVLQNDAVIPKVYYVNNDSTVVTLTAKETGSKYNLNTDNVSIDGDIDLSITNIGEDYCDGQITDNYSISCEVLVNTDSTNQYPDKGQSLDYNRVAELILPFNPSNTHRFDISSILKNAVSTPMPTTTLTGSTLLPTVMQPYYCKLAELYPLIENTSTVKKRFKTDTDVQWTINSSLDRYAPNDMSEYLGEAYININPNWNYTGTYSAPNWSLVFNDTLLSTDTGTTSVEYSIWNFDNTIISEAWQTGTTFAGITVGSYYGRISGTTEGRTFEYNREFSLSTVAVYQDTNTYPVVRNEVEFLTQSPAVKQIQRNSNEFLYFVLNKDYGFDLTMKGDLYFYDGTSSTGQTFFTIATGSTNAGGCMIMNLSYDKLGLVNWEVSGSTNRKIKRAELTVWQDDGVNTEFQYSKTKTYRFASDEMPRKMGILFQNTLGMYDSFDFIGVVEESVKREYDTYTVPLNYNTDGSLAKGFKNSATYNCKILKRIKCNTGWIDENHFDWLMELMNTNNIYSTSTEFQNYLNMIEYTYKKSSLNDLFDIEVTFDWTIFEPNVGV